jgi:signal transduction histidine kinase
MVRAYNNIGVAKQYLGALEEAATFIIKASKLYERLGDSLGMAKSFNNLGILNSNLKNYEKALEFHLKALKIKLVKDNPRSIFGSFNNIGLTYKNLDRFPEAIEAFLKAKEIADSINYNKGILNVLNNVGRLYSEMGEQSKAIENFEAGIKYANQNSDLNALTSFHVNLADSYFKLNSFRKAEFHALEGIRIAEEISSYIDMREGNLIISMIYEKLNEFKKAYSSLRIYEGIRDSLESIEHKSIIESLQTQYETEKKDLEIKNLTAESELDQLKIEKGRIYILSLSIFAILIVLIVVFYYRHNRQRLLMKMELEKEQLEKDRLKVVIDTEEKERVRVARELHDGLGQMLSTVRLFVSDMDDQHNDIKVNRTLQALDSTIAEVRTISYNMMPIKLMEVGLASAIDDMAAKVNETGQIQMEVHNTSLLRVSEAKSVALYRTIQEVVNNAVKYAKADKIKINVYEIDGEIMITIVDNGQGFNTENIAKSKGIGWSNIYARMDLIGGNVMVNSTFGVGTEIKLNLPSEKASLLSAG